MRRITLWSLSTITILVLLLSYRTSTSSLPGSSVAAGRNGGDVAANGPTTPSDGGTTPSQRQPVLQHRHTDIEEAVADQSFRRSQDLHRDQHRHQLRAGPGADHRHRPARSPSRWSPRCRGTTVADQEINGYAVPILNEEVVQAQSATIDMVSGATFTSDGYIQSLQSAIDQAHL